MSGTSFYIESTALRKQEAHGFVNVFFSLFFSTEMNCLPWSLTNKTPFCIHFFGMHGTHTVCTFYLHPDINYTYLYTLKMKNFLSFACSISYFQSQAVKEFISFRRTTQLRIQLLIQTNPKVYSLNDSLQKKIHTPTTVFKPLKDLTLNRVSRLILHYKLYTTKSSSSMSQC